MKDDNCTSNLIFLAVGAAVGTAIGFLIGANKDKFCPCNKSEIEDDLEELAYDEEDEE